MAIVTLVTAAGGFAGVPIADDRTSAPELSLSVPSAPIAIPEAALVLSARVRDITRQNAEFETRRAELGRNILKAAAERDDTLAAVEVLKDEQASLRASSDRLTRALYQAGSTVDAIDLSSTASLRETAHASQVLENLIRQTAHRVQDADKELAAARARAAETDNAYRNANALFAALDRKVAWVTQASEWVRTRRAADATAPVLPDADLPIGAFETAMGETRNAPCKTSWWLVAAGADPEAVSRDPRLAMRDAADWICRGGITEPAGLGGGIHNNLEPSSVIDRATRWKAYGFPDRPAGRVLIVGDSLGEGMKLAGLGKCLDALGYSATIDTRVGRTTSEALRVLQKYKSQDFALIVVETGTNDGGSAENYRRAIQSTLNLYAVPVLWIPPHLTRLDNFDRVVEEYAAAEPRLRIVDWDPVLRAHPEYLAGDGIHLTMRGYAAMADLTIAGLTGGTSE